MKLTGAEGLVTRGQGVERETKGGLSLGVNEESC